MANTAWAVREHGAVRKLAENLWWVDGSIPNMSLRRCMTVARFNDGRLVIHSAIALQEADMQALEAWGTPAFLIVPSGYHRLDAPRYKQRYPQLQVFAPAAARAKVEQVVKVDGRYTDFPSDEVITLRDLEGTREGLMTVKSSDGTTLVFNDCLFNMDKKKDFLGNLITTLMGSAPGPRVSRLAKAALVKDQPTYRRELERLAEIPDLVRVIVAHEKVATGPDARACLLGAKEYLRAE